jgi:predicted PurR-regulated permease PerM
MNRRLLRLLQDKRVRRAALLVALWVPAVVILIAVREVLLPFLLAGLLAYVIAPLVRRLSSKSIAGRSLPPWGSVLMLYAGLVAILWIGGSIFVPQIYRELVRLGKDGSEMLNQIDDAHVARWGEDLEKFFDTYNVPVRIITPGSESDVEESRDSREIELDLVEITQGLVRDAKGWLRTEATLVFGQLQRLVAGVLGFIFRTFLVLMLTAFIAADTSRILNFLFSITPVADRARLDDLLARIDRGLSGVLRGQLTICLINGALTLVGLLLLKVKFAFLLATIAAVLSLVPIFGSILSTVPIVIVALSGGLTPALLALLWIVGIHALEANLLNPKIMGDAAKIHPALVVLALIVGEHFYGIVGALLAVPLMSILVTIYKAAQARAMQLDAEIADEERNPPALPRTTLPRGARGPRPRLRREHASP